MLADDDLGAEREDRAVPLADGYLKAFHEIDTDGNNELIVAEFSGIIVGTMHLIFTPSLSYRGGRRCTVESVRVERSLRGKGIGREMMIWAIQRANERGCVFMQLTSHNNRDRAHSFYDVLGFEKTHIGMKLKLK